MDQNRRLLVFGGLGALVAMTPLGRVGKALAQEENIYDILHRNSRIQPVTDETYLQTLLSNDDGFIENAALVLFYGTQWDNENAQRGSDHLTWIFNELSIAHEDSIVNGLPILFARYNLSSRDNIDLVVPKLIGSDGTGIMMYKAGAFRTIQGKHRDYLRGAPKTRNGAENEWLPFLKKEWIESNLTNTSEMAWVFRGTADQEQIPYRP
jgi:hypothetical protein